MPIETRLSKGSNPKVPHEMGNTTEQTKMRLVIQAMDPNVASILEKKLCPEEILIKIITAHPYYWSKIMKDINTNEITVTPEVFQKFQKNYNACKSWIGNGELFDYDVLFQITKNPKEIKKFCQQINSLSIENHNPLAWMLYLFSKNYLTIDNLKQLEQEGIELNFLGRLFHQFNDDDLTFLKGLKQIHFDGGLQYLAFSTKEDGCTLQQCKWLREKYPQDDPHSYTEITNFFYKSYNFSNSSL